MAKETSVKGNLAWFGPTAYTKKDLKDYLTMPHTVIRNGVRVSIEEHNKKVNGDRRRSK